jgi:hypothetical protein
MIEVPILQRGSKCFPCRREARRECQLGGIIAWLIIVFLVVSASLMIGGLFLAHSIKVHETRNDVQVETPFGSVHVQHNGNRPESTGIPMYPGAKPLHDGSSASVDLSELFGDKDLHIAAGKWQTPDPIDKVQKYYEDKFPDMSVIQHANKVEMHSVNGHGKKIIALCDCGHGTEIALASVGEPRAN